MKELGHSQAPAALAFCILKTQHCYARVFIFVAVECHAVNVTTLTVSSVIHSVKRSLNAAQPALPSLLDTFITTTPGTSVS